MYEMINTMDWTPEDTRVCDALAYGGHLTYDQPLAVLDIVEAARSFERARIARILDEQPPYIRASASAILAWIDEGAPDTPDIMQIGGVNGTG